MRGAEEVGQLMDEACPDRAPWPRPAYHVARADIRSVAAWLLGLADRMDGARHILRSR